MIEDMESEADDKSYLVDIYNKVHNEAQINNQMR